MHVDFAIHAFKYLELQTTKIFRRIAIKQQHSTVIVEKQLCFHVIVYIFININIFRVYTTFFAHMISMIHIIYLTIFAMEFNF